MQRIYDSKLQDLADFEPIEPGRVGMYVCGPTVQSAPHIGHLRSALVYDIMRRWLLATGHEVTFIRNVTDIDDKILEKSAGRSGVGEKWWALAYRVELEFSAAYRAIGIMPPTYEPRATANITQMIELILKLIEKGHAYHASDGSADVYFDTASWPNYGELTRQSAEQMEPAEDGDPRGKRDARDFALWKSLKDHEPESASWDSPWGRGRPGWHIECSAMAKRYLGASFDIHGGGLDLRFPHHENELAQSRAAGDDFAKHWVHNGLVNTGGQKMSKSLGNSLFAADLLAASRPIVLRYFLGSAHYRSVLDFSERSLHESASAFERIEAFLDRATEKLVKTGEERALNPDLLPEKFTAAMLDDFNVPEALAVIHTSVKAGNKALDDGSDLRLITKFYYEVSDMLTVLGINPQADIWSRGARSAEKETRALGLIIEEMISLRSAARDAKDFKRSDEIRDLLQGAGVTLEDSQDETRWSVK